ncbi:MAG TPA: AAA family ATPase, partial [Chloroflexota bacterium]|nr:AAA family ATPase [Chloroflexota bacterium]
MITEWRKRPDERVRWLEGRCFVHTATLSYGPFPDMLRRFAGIVDDDSPRRARQRLDNAVERLFPGDAEAHAVLANMLAMQLRREEKALLGRLPGQVLRERIFGLAEQLMRRLSQERPLVLFLEDMQWSDASTAELVEHLLPLSCTERFAIVAAGRPEPESPVARIAAAAENSDGPRPERLTLERLPDSASLAMVRDLLAMPELPPQLGVLISNKAEGNPFFVEEIIRSLIELGALNRSGETWTTTRLMDTISVPDTLQGLIMARIDRLPDETKDVVQHAAVIGRTFLYRILLAIAEASPSLDADLTHLERSELIRERTREPEVEYTFEHALTQEMAYQSLLSSRVRELHRRVGQAMERIFAYRLGEYYPIVAEHFRSGEDWEKTAEYEILAGNQAAAMFAPEARVHYERALDALQHLKSTPENKRRQIDLTIALAREVFFGAGAQSPEIGPVVERLDAAETPAASLVHPNGRTSDEDRLRVARLYAWIANAYSIQGDFPGVARYVDKATAASKDLQDAQLAARLGQVQLHRGRFKQAITWLAQAVDELPRHERWIEWIHANGA